MKLINAKRWLGLRLAVITRADCESHFIEITPKGIMLFTYVAKLILALGYCMSNTERRKVMVKVTAWDPSVHATGFEEIDRQHKFLFDFVESYRKDLNHNAEEKGYEEALGILSLYVETHFGFEEKCVHFADCPFARQNETEHNNFVTMLEGEKSAFDKDGFVKERAIDLLDRLNTWLDSHIRRVDKNLNFK